MTAGLFLFVGGFFLTRISRLERNNCTSCYHLKDCDATNILRDPEHSVEICLEARGKIVLLVVDALKYEFMEWHEGVTNVPYRNKIPIVQEMLQKYPSNTRLYKSIADPPTTTMQRIKAITTGTLPTFIDISSNFATEQIDEDNLIDQNAEKGIVFMGDDTWTGLYPGKFLRQFPSPSFNVWDLDTVDREVRNRIFFELQKKDWSLLIAHTLGVDHCGHKHGPNHPEMARKLNETNTLIKEIIETLDDDMTLFIIGDHGMTETGDHGGDSINEVEAALFVYSKNPLQNVLKIESPKSVNQIDIVATIASILGTPIPFSNIGSVIVDALPSFEKSKASDFWFTAHSVWRNIVQTRKYIDAYSIDSFLFTEEKIAELDKKYNLLIEEAKKLDNDDDDEAIRNFVQHAQDYFKLLRDSCIEIWVQFDSNLMSKGLLLMFCTLFFTYFLINGVTEERMTKVFESAFLREFTILNFIALVTIYSLYTLQIIDEFVNTTFFITGALSLLLLVILVVQNWDIIATTWYNNSRNKKINYLVRIILLLTVCGLFSNSYVVEEDRVFSFFIITLICLLIYNIGEDTSTEGLDKKHRASNKSISPYKYRTLLIILGFVVCLAIRLSSYFWRCREEQAIESCSSTFLGKVGSITSNSLERILLTVSLVVLALYITIVRIWMRNCGNLSGFSPSITVARYCPGLIVVCMGSYWVLQRMPKDTKVKFALSYQMNALPGVVYFFIIFAVFVLFFKPLGVFLLPQKRETFSVYQGENVVPKLFDKVKELFYAKKSKDDNDIPIIYGLGTVYSAAFISLSVFLTLLYALLLGSVLAPSTILMVITCATVLAIVAMERYRNANDIG